MNDTSGIEGQVSSCKVNGHGFNDDGVCIYCHEDDGRYGNASNETLETVFMSLPNGCVLKTHNSYNEFYTCSYKANSKSSITTSGITPNDAVIKMAELLALQENTPNE